MTKSELQSTHEDAEIIDVDTNAIKEDKKPSTNTKALWLACFILFLAVLSCAGGAFWFFKNHYQPLANEVGSQRALATQVEQVAQSQNQVNARIQQTQDAQSQLSSQLATQLQAQLKKQITSNNEQVATLVSQQQAQITRLDSDVSKLSGNRSSDWLIAEADYLSRMAGRKLWLEDDTQTAILLLKEADLRLEDAADPALIPVRKAIAQDIQRIQQVNPVSVTSIALSLSGLMNNIDNLPINTLQLPDAITPQNPEVSNSVKDWKKNIAAVWHSLVDDFISIDRRDTKLEPLMTEAQRFLLKERLFLSLQQAQYAALHNNSTLYQASLTQAETIISSHFDLQAIQISQVFDTLNTLKAANIKRSLPDELKSNNLLKETANRYLNRALEETQDKKGLGEERIKEKGIEH